jgi:hypothetical protein
MAFGPGKYDDLCTDVREKAKAEGVLLIILGGEKGPGFACQASPEITLVLPDILEDVAAQIRRDGIGDTGRPS